MNPSPRTTIMSMIQMQQIVMRENLRQKVHVYIVSTNILVGAVAREVQTLIIDFYLKVSNYNNQSISVYD